jgi:transcriptional regulator with GAF, ATPase, and Fis domain
MHVESVIIGAMAATPGEIYEAVLALSRSIAGRTDLDALVSGVAESLRRIVRFDYLGLVLHDPQGNAMQGYVLNAPGTPEIRRPRFAVDQDPAGWVWLHQEPLILSPLDTETRWPEFVRQSLDKGTLFLDEIGEMPLELQPKLLRAIQDQEFERVGGARTIKTDVRFVAATSRDLKAIDSLIEVAYRKMPAQPGRGQ